MSILDDARKCMESVRITCYKPAASGGRKGWYRVVANVDRAKTNGYAFEGDFLGEGENDLPMGAIVIKKLPTGSAKNGYYIGRIFEVGLDEDNEPALMRYRATPDEDPEDYEWSGHFLSFRDKVAAALDRYREDVTYRLSQNHVMDTAIGMTEEARPRARTRIIVGRGASLSRVPTEDLVEELRARAEAGDTLAACSLVQGREQ